MGSGPPHPYVPESLDLPGFVPATISYIQILLVYGIASLLVFAFSWLLSGKAKHLCTLDRLIICWFMFSGLTHMFLEGYFVFTPNFFQRTSPNYFDEVWKEYSKGDSRYAMRDTTVIAVEGITAVIEGPACLFAAYGIATQKPYAYVLQLAICLGQLYGDIVYFLTPWLNTQEYAAGPFYYWFYYIFMNNIWVVIPSLIALRCWGKITQAFDKKTKKTQ